MAEWLTGQKAPRTILILGLLSFLVWPLAVIAIIAGHRLRRVLSKDAPASMEIRTVTWGLVLAYVALGIVTAFVLIAGIFVAPRSYRASRALGAIDEMDRLQAAIEQYASEREGIYPLSLEDLVEQKLITREVLEMSPAGYVRMYSPRSLASDAESSALVSRGYTLQYTPTGLLAHLPGAYHFYTDETRVVRYSVNGPASVNSRPFR